MAKKRRPTKKGTLSYDGKLFDCFGVKTCVGKNCRKEIPRMYCKRHQEPAAARVALPTAIAPFSPEGRYAGQSPAEILAARSASTFVPPAMRPDYEYAPTDGAYLLGRAPRFFHGRGRGRGGRW